jgi:hypothetical protein
MVIHFDTGGAFSMPISGRHTKVSCGRTFQDRHKPNSKRHTAAWNMVTCKQCLEKYGASKE